MDDWKVRLREGAPDAAWDLFVDRYRRLLFAAIRHYVQDHDDVMDVFAWVCEALREDDLRRLRTYLDASSHRARFSTWLVTVVRHLAVDWLRHRDGRKSLSAAAEGFAPLRRHIVQSVFIERRTHVEAYELIRTHHPPGPSYREFLVELRATYQAVNDGRRGRLFREIVPPPPSESDNESARAVEVPDQHAWLDRALATLTPEDRVAVELYVVEELPAADIARIIGLPNAKAVYNRVYRALDALRAWLEAAGIAEGDL